MKTANWKDFNPHGTCNCDDQDPARLTDDIDNSSFIVCLTCNFEILPCTYCGSTPCKCVEINNQVDELRGN